jgi:hypothetical protein
MDDELPAHPNGCPSEDLGRRFSLFFILGRHKRVVKTMAT